MPSQTTTKTPDGKRRTVRVFSEDEMEAEHREHLAWIKTRRKSGKRADLSNTLINNINWENKNLQSACLRKVFVNACDFKKINFDFADLSNAVFLKTKIEKSTFFGANLVHCDLREVEHLQAPMFGFANLTRALFPQELADFKEPLQTFEEAARNSRKLFIATLLACAYSAVAIISPIKDQALKLPIVQNEVDFGWFSIIMPLVLLCMFIYFHLNLHHVWRRLARLPAIFPDGRTMLERAYPWIPLGIVRNRLPFLVKKKWSIQVFQDFVTILLVWLAVPGAVLLFFISSFTTDSGSALGRIVVGFAFVVSLVVARFFWVSAMKSFHWPHPQS